jgi:hypothetical protein
MTTTISTASSRMTNIILAVIASEAKMYTALRLLIANDMVRANNKDFMNSLHEGLTKWGTLNEKQREALSRTLRSYGPELVQLADASRAAKNTTTVREDDGGSQHYDESQAQ